MNSSLINFCFRLFISPPNFVNFIPFFLDDEKETKHLLALEGAESRLRLYQIDLLNYDSIVPAITGAVGVFHLASPCIVDEVKDPEVGSRLFFFFFF